MIIVLTIIRVIETVNYSEHHQLLEIIPIHKNHDVPETTVSLLGNYEKSGIKLASELGSDPNTLRCTPKFWGYSNQGRILLEPISFTNYQPLQKGVSYRENVKIL